MFAAKVVFLLFKTTKVSHVDLFSDIFYKSIFFNLSQVLYFSEIKSKNIKSKYLNTQELLLKILF